jgi:16S rRNA G966 N2-methylase RsmD
MNTNILAKEVQNYINEHINADVNKIALAKSLFVNVSPAEIANQIAAKKKSISKLPTWFKQQNIYYPALLSIEQCSSETTGAYKASLTKGNSVLDLTAGFGVDSYFFSKQAKQVLSCEINAELAAITSHNSTVLGAQNQKVLTTDGIEFLENTELNFGTIYIDPARRKNSGKVFKLKDCTPDITSILQLLLQKAERIIVKTSPLLDIRAGLSELKNVSEIHIVSVKNECKELLWVIDKIPSSETHIVCATLNQTDKILKFPFSALQDTTTITVEEPHGFLYEPDVALLKSGGFNFIAQKFKISKLHQDSQLYYSDQINPDFLGRIFKVKTLLSINELKKDKALVGNVIVRNFPANAADLVKKYKIAPSDNDFIIFTQTLKGYLAIKAEIIQHY